MATFFRNSVVKEIGVTPTKVLETQSNSRATVIGMSLTNLTLGAILVSVELQDETSTRGYYCKEVLVPANTSLRLVNGGEKLILANSNELYVSCNTADAVDVLLSYVEII
jgi:hypothetical protein